MRVNRSPLRSLVAAVAAFSVTFTVLIATGESASAVVPVAPSGLAPNGTAVSGIPTLSWTRQADASSYDVQMSTNQAFSSTIWTDNTVNVYAIPTEPLPIGTVYWRVRGRNSSGAGEWSSNASVDRGPVGAPVLTGPADGAQLQQPGSPPILTWQPVTGVDLYTIQISPDDDFTDPAQDDEYTTPATSFVLPDLQVPQTYFWRVKGRLAGSSGVFTEFSTSRAYEIKGLSPATLVSPPDDINGNVQDVVLDWSPVPGAATYELQVSTDINFPAPTIVDAPTGIRGTRYSPATTYDNDQYYWRVRGVDGSGNKPDWSTASVWKFKRNWPDQPSLQWPANGATVGNPFYFQWTGVPHASLYRVELSHDSSFNDFETCTTVHTTLTPFATDQGDCAPGALGTYYWRVRAFDGPRDVQTDFISAQVRSFTYAPATVTQATPANGASVAIPRLTWQPLAGASKYRVTVTNTTSGSSSAVTTAATSYTPRSRLTVGQSYRWQVQSVDEDGRLGPGLLPGSQRTFTVIAQPTPTESTPEPTSPSGATQRFPTLTWTPVVDATRYAVWIRPAGTIGFTLIDNDFGYPEGQDFGTGWLAAGDYEWRVDAYDGDTFLDDSVTNGEFTIVNATEVTGYEAAIGGNQITGNAGTAADICTATLPSACQDLRQTPVLSWDSNPNTGYYTLIISRDAELTNTVLSVGVRGTMWSDTDALPDSQAGTAFFWVVIPCKANNKCAPLQHADHQFNKKSNQVKLLSPITTPPGAPPVRQDDVTLTWEDFLATETAAGGSGSALTSAARTEAYRYRVQTSVDPNFQSIIETRDVDQTTFTSYQTTYPEGPVYWRVQAIDGSGNLLSLSDAASGQFEKKSPVPSLVSPASGSVISGNEPFTWSPLFYAMSYDVEIYKNNDQIGNSANRVVSANVKQIAYSLSKPLPASSEPYTWRVRRADASGRRGAWSALTPFTVTGVAPVLVSPAPGAVVPPREGVFGWQPVDAAANYRFERRRPGSSTISESVTTPALGWAPSSALAAGAWQWRVTSLDASGQVMGTTDWRDFSVVDPPVATTAPVISGSGQIGTVLSVLPPTWNLPGVSTTYQWLNDGKAITGATGTLYAVTSADLGDKLSVKATGTKLGYATGTSTSNVITGALGAPIAASSLPLISGVAKVGKTLTATTGSWPGAPKYAYQWLRNGTVIKDADASTYKPTLTDANRKISVRVTATTAGYQPGTATSATVLIAKMRSTSKVTLLDDTIKKTERATITVAVHVNGNPAPTGKVKVYRDHVLLKTFKLTGAMKGALVAKLPQLGKGKFKVWVKYQGNFSTKKSVSEKVILKVGR